MFIVTTQNNEEYVCGAIDVLETSIVLNTWYPDYDETEGKDVVLLDRQPIQVRSLHKRPAIHSVKS